MMTPRKLIEYISVEPYRPFRINMASGQTFDVRHLENVAVSRNSIRIFAPVDNSNSEERWHDVLLMLIESVDPLNASLAQDQN